MVVLAVMAVFAAGCQKELLTDYTGNADNQRGGVAIAFDNGIVDNPVGTRALLPLSDYQSTMGVWGWRSDNEMLDEPLFKNHLITYSTSLNGWTYTPLKYWEQHSHYRFYAYTPHSSDSRATGATVSIDEASGFISIDNVLLTGHNIRKNDASHTLKNTFAESDDVDWMIARQGQTANGRTPEKVQFLMNHILAKFNVRIRVSSSLVSPSSGITSISLSSLSVGAFKSKGSFEQKLLHVPSATSVTDMAAVEWSVSNTPDVTLASGADIILDNEYTYVVESLLLPQDVTDTQTLNLRYTLTFNDSRTEYFDYALRLNDAFGTGSLSGAGGRFLSGYSYTLSININPDVITYDAGASSWEDVTAVDKTIQ